MTEQPLLPEPQQPPPSPSYIPRDPFRLLAVLSIVLGIVLVVFAVVFWALTHRESSLIMGAGVTLTIGGGIRNVLVGLVDRLPEWQHPPTSTDRFQTEEERHREQRP